MKLYNKSGRAFVLNSEHVISGGRVPEHDIVKNRIYFDPNKEIEVKDSCGDKLLKDYPKEIMKTGASEKARAKPKRKVVAKKAPAPAKVAA